MSFPNRGIWMPDGSGFLSNGEMGGVSLTRNQQKRDYQGIVDASEPESFFIKKQAIETAGDVRTTSGNALMSYSLLPDVNGSKSGDNIGNHLFSRHFQNLNDPGMRKVRVNEVRVSDNSLPERNGNSAQSREKGTIQRNGSNMIFGPINNSANAHAHSVNPAFGSAQKGRSSVVPPNSMKKDGNFLLHDQFFNGLDNGVLSICESYNNAKYNPVLLQEQYVKTNGSSISTGSSYNGHEHLFVVDPLSDKSSGLFNMPVVSTYNKGDTDIPPLNSIQDLQDATSASLRTAYGKENSVVLSLGKNYEQGEQTTIYFGGIQDEPEDDDTSSRPICYQNNFLNQTVSPSPKALEKRDNEGKLNMNIIYVDNFKTVGSLKSTEQKTKKGSSNNFPANVKSLLSTGMLDGIPVKYVSWSREKNLRGVIHGTGYLCSCQECSLSKAVNAYEFERHAGCKTKHPNNHIFFENGKTMYAVVQELRNTPQEMLFEVIQNVTGSPINQKNFQTWKASYQATTRELQRIYGKDEMIIHS